MECDTRPVDCFSQPTLPTMQHSHWVTSLEAIYQIACSFLCSHKRLYSTFSHLEYSLWLVSALKCAKLVELPFKCSVAFQNRTSILKNITGSTGFPSWLSWRCSLFFPILNLGGGILECCRTTTVDYRLYFPTCAVWVERAAEGPLARILKNSFQRRLGMTDTNGGAPRDST